jgi:hypothetical protein
MALIATAIEPAHICNYRSGALGLDLERGNQSILGPDDDPVALPFQIDADGELRVHGGLSYSAASTLAEEDRFAPFS